VATKTSKISLRIQDDAPDGLGASVVAAVAVVVVVAAAVLVAV